MPKEIRYNVPSAGDADEFGDVENYTLHVDGVTVYFDEIEEVGRASGFAFKKNGEDVAFIESYECDASPIVAKNYAENNPNEKVRFAD